ncbi:MAG: heme-binding protein [Verrucomicrobiales bacterium]|nr:heme-binding protein [Verrucomicrobiales bacterium]
MMTRPGFSAFAAGMIVTALVAGGCQVTRAGYATAPYQVLHRSGSVEIRSYPPLRLVETSTDGDDFMRLFRYISKGNASETRIAMTTPVFMTDLGTTHGRMAFVLPEDLTTPPAPSEPGVELRTTEANTVAVLRFRGGQQGPDGEAARKLTAWMAHEGIPAEGAPVFAYFDPPWIPGFLCRNEVMIRTTWPPPAVSPAPDAGQRPVASDVGRVADAR